MTMPDALMLAPLPVSHSFLPYEHDHEHSDQGDGIRDHARHGEQH
jgi:hypothetical protein